MNQSNTSDSPTALTVIRSVAKRVCENYPIARMEVSGVPEAGFAKLGSEMGVLVEFLPDSHPGLLEMGALREDLEQQLGCRVELLSRRAVEQSHNSYRRHAILTNPITVYAR